MISVGLDGWFYSHTCKCLDIYLNGYKFDNK